MNTSQLALSGGCMSPPLRFLPILPGKLQQRAHLSRLSRTGKWRLHGEQFGQATQIDGQHGQRKDIRHLVSSAQLGLTNRRAMLFGIAEQDLDHLADHLANAIPRMPHGARVDVAPAPGALAGLGVVFVSRWAPDTNSDE